MPAAVFDCMVFVQSLANAKGPACACYELVRSGKLILLQFTILEPPALLRRFPQVAAGASRE